MTELNEFITTIALGYAFWFVGLIGIYILMLIPVELIEAIMFIITLIILSVLILIVCPYTTATIIMDEIKNASINTNFGTLTAEEREELDQQRQGLLTIEKKE